MLLKGMMVFLLAANTYYDFKSTARREKNYRYTATDSWSYATTISKTNFDERIFINYPYI